MVCNAVGKSDGIVDAKTTIRPWECGHNFDIMAHGTAKNIGVFSIHKISSYTLALPNLMLMSD
jgi:hypothetical protein